MDVIQQVSQHFSGVSLPNNFSLDGKIYRFGKSKRLWIVGYKWEFKSKQYERAMGGDWSNPGMTFDFKSYEEHELTKKEKLQAESMSMLIKHTVEQETVQKRSHCILESKNKIQSGEDADSHPYLVKKRIQSFGVKQVKGKLQVPVYKSGRLVGLQFISEQGEKWFETGTEISGSMFPLKEYQGSSFVFLAEGFATAASLQMNTDWPVICCFSADNMVKVAKSFNVFNGPYIIACCDRDKVNEQTGMRAGALVASKISQGNKRSFILFPWDDEERIGDFNDLHCEDGIEAVQNRLALIDENIIQDDYFLKMEKSGFTTWEDEKAVYQYHELLDYMQTKTPYWYFPELREFYIYDGKVYKPYPEHFVKEYAQRKFSPPPTGDTVRSTFLNLAKAHNCAKKEKLESGQTNVVAFKNQLIDFSDPKNPTPMEHSPKNFITKLIPFNFNPDAECPTYDQLLKNILEDQDYIDTVNEFLGWAISGVGYEMLQNFMIFDGEGENGKSTLCRRFAYILGKHNTSSVSFNDIGRVRFSEEPLMNSLLNIAEEEPPSVFKDTGHIKKITGGTPVNIEGKGKPVLNMNVKAKIILTYNKMPVLHDKSHGFTRRPIIIPFRFNLKDPENHGRIIRDIDRKLNQESEGIIARAMEGYLRLIERGHFLKLDNTKSRLEEMYRESDPIYEFVAERIEVDNDSYVWGNDVLKHILEECPEYSPDNKREILKSFRSALKATRKMKEQDIRTRRGTGKDYKFPGIKIV